MAHLEAELSHTQVLFDSNDSPVISLPPPTSSRGHQRSRTTVELPPLFSRSPSVSPTRPSAFMPFNRRSRDPSPEARTSAGTIETDTAASEPQRKVKPGTVGKIASWFEGSSEPVNISLIPSPRKEDPDPLPNSEPVEEAIHSGSSSMDNLTQRPRRPGPNVTSTANTSRFSFFKRTATATQQAKPNPDDLIQMDIREALLPEGPADEVSAAAYKTLQLNAEALLRKFQMSYAENLGALRQITSEKNIQTDDLEAAQTRNEHLKLQLLEMAEKASEQEKTIAHLKMELNMPQQSVRMIMDDEKNTIHRRGRRNRVSDVSCSDESFVDSEMSSALSVFSDVESIRTPSTSVAPSPTMKHASLYSPRLLHSPRVQAQATPVLVPQCQNCHNMSASEAWTVVEMMKMESVGLKQRISELENAQDSALDFLTAMKF